MPEPEPELVKPCFVAPPAPPEHSVKVLHLSQRTVLEHSACATVWHGFQLELLAEPWVKPSQTPPKTSFGIASASFEMAREAASPVKQLLW